MLVATCIGNLGLRHGRHLSVTSTGVHADCARQNSCHSPPYSATACGPRICGPFRPVGQLQPGGQSSKCICPWNSQSLHGICEPIWSPHTEYRVLLEPHKNEAQMDGGCAAKEVSSYLDEFMWRERFVKTPQEAMNSIMCDIAQQYPF